MTSPWWLPQHRRLLAATAAWPRVAAPGAVLPLDELAGIPDALRSPNRYDLAWAEWRLEGEDPDGPTSYAYRPLPSADTPADLRAFRNTPTLCIARDASPGSVPTGGTPQGTRILMLAEPIALVLRIVGPWLEDGTAEAYALMVRWCAYRASRETLERTVTIDKALGAADASAGDKAAREYLRECGAPIRPPFNLWV